MKRTCTALAMIAISVAWLGARELKVARGRTTIRLQKPIRLQADGNPIDSSKYRSHSGPMMADLNGDGLKDLLVGNYGGHFQVYTNVGTAKEPVFKSNGLLQVNGKVVKLNNW